MAVERHFRIAASAVWTATAENPRPDVAFVPPMERRRLTGVERAALSVAWRVKSEAELPVVFASRWGEIGVTAKLMRQFHEEGEMSPAGFSASVHNAAPGAFSLLTKSHAPYTAVAARERSLECGLLEALAMDREVLWVFAEEATPELYRGEFGDEQSSVAVAMRLAPGAAGDGEVRAEFRVADELPPAAFGDLVDFIEGRTKQFVASAFILSRE